MKTAILTFIILLTSNAAFAATKCDSKAVAIANLAGDSKDMQVDESRVTERGTTEISLSNYMAQGYEMIMTSDCIVVKMEITGDL